MHNIKRLNPSPLHTCTTKALWLAYVGPNLMLAPSCSYSDHILCGFGYEYARIGICHMHESRTKLLNCLSSWHTHLHTSIKCFECVQQRMLAIRTRLGFPILSLQSSYSVNILRGFGYEYAQIGICDIHESRTNC